MKLSEILDVAKCSLVRDGKFSTLGLSNSRHGNTLGFLYDKKFLKELTTNSNISCLITLPEFVELIPNHFAVVVTDDPLSAFYRTHQYLLHCTTFYGKSFASQISPTARIHESANIAKENVVIGDGVIIEPCTTILPGTKIEAEAVIRAGVVIGGEGFEPKVVDGQHIIVGHAGGVWIKEGVEIQSNSHIAKSLFRDHTIIGSNSKIDALVHVAHNVSIGKNCEIAAKAMIAGSVQIGDNVWVGPGALISNSITIGNGAFVTLGSVVVKDVESNTKVSGNFAVNHRQFLKFVKKMASGDL